MKGGAKSNKIITIPAVELEWPLRITGKVGK